MPLDRRRFLKFLGATVGGIAVAEAIPFNRVWSFPKEIVQLNTAPLATVYYDRGAMAALKNNLIYYFADKATGKRLTPDIRMTHPMPEFDIELFSKEQWPDMEIKVLKNVAESIKTRQLPEKTGNNIYLFNYRSA